jgi:Na+-translocating ferredoxin:NAD+ oxidoreductase RnfC subunit
MPEPKDYGVDEDRDMKLLAVSRLTSRLGIAKYDVEAPIVDEAIVPKTIKIKMSQHIGSPSVPCAQKGDKVKAGDVLGKSAEGLSVCTHASMDGEVLTVTHDYVVLRGAKS